MSDNIVVGLVAGLFVTLLVVIFRYLWQGVLVPWFEDRVYKDAKIEGKWFSLYPTTKELRQETIRLKRQGHEVSGEMICACGPDEGKSYTISGSFRNLILPLIYETDDKSKTDRGTITLKVMRNAERLEGKIAAYQNSSDSIFNTPVIWFRSKTDLKHHLAQIKERRDAIEKARRMQDASEKEIKRLTSTAQETEEKTGTSDDSETDNQTKEKTKG